jgi:cupin fold WbuC family metalloprotein
MKKIYSKVEPHKLLHIVHRYGEIVDRTNVAPEDEFLQLATLRMKKGTTFRPHKHIYKQGKDQVIAQESWVVIKGKVRVIMFDLNDKIIATPILKMGDCSMTFAGGHTYEILEDDTVVYEYKTGPYTGIKNDKVFINDNR